MLHSILTFDETLFRFFNSTLTFPLFDWLMPFITDYHKNKMVMFPILILYCMGIWKGKRQTRIALLLVIPTIALGDIFNSFVIKEMFGRLRPCHTLPDVHLLVDCGSGLSFPSSHAVNNFSVATLLSFYVRKYFYAFFSFAFLIAYSRVYVGVHYPLDVMGGAIIGILTACIILFVWKNIRERYFTSLGEPS